MSSKKYLILADNNTASRRTILAIVNVLFGRDVRIVYTGDFSGTDLLPCDFLFLGFAKTNSAQCLYIQETFKHINLAGRKCALFSPLNDGGKTIRFLTDLIKDSEIKLDTSPAGNGVNSIKNWVLGILKNEE
jgi:hypothetical protein